MTMATDVIVAESTPAGRGGIAVVRLTGPCLLSVAEKMSCCKPQPRYAHHVKVRDESGNIIDDALMLYFPGPRSFTGEDVLEFHCHGSPVVVKLITDASIQQGARLARPGEFTERAFLNGKMDLAQAEAVADLIESTTRTAARSALRSLDGYFSQQIQQLSGQLTKLRMHVEAAIDFPEEEIDFLHDPVILEQLEDLKRQFDHLLEGTRQGCLIREGIRVALAGKPNVGKSSLMNRLCREDKAIVTHVPGTTRDVLEQAIQINGYPVHLVDTAGLRSSRDPVEHEGVRRAKLAVQKADLVLYLIDSSDFDELQPFSGIEALQTDAKVLPVFNKIDVSHWSVGNNVQMGRRAVNVSVVKDSGIEELKASIVELAGLQRTEDQVYTARRRHLYAVQTAHEHLLSGERQIRQHHSGELLAEELRLSHQKLGEITGQFSADDLLGEIFSRFCIGK